MVTRIGINGFGRIGRLTLRTIKQYHSSELEIVAVNDLGDPQTNAHLLKWDSTYGRFDGEVSTEGDNILVDGKPVRVFAERDPGAIPWDKLGVDIVLESTGFFTDATKAAAHRKHGVKKVIISAPAKNDDITIVMGVNQRKYEPKKHHVISNASCTTNALAPVAQVLHDFFTVQKGMMNTVHSYTNDQKLQDIAHKDLRRARAACVNIIPTSTGAASAIGRVIPDLEGDLHGVSLRVPTITVSVVDLVVVTRRTTTVEGVNQAFRQAEAGPLKGILEVCDEELVSMDFKGNPHSAIVDSLNTMVVGDNMIKVLAWYDNEWGYSCRLGDLAAFIAAQGL